MKSRHAQRSREIRSDREHAVACRECGARSAGRAAGRAREVVGVVGGAVDLVEALPIAKCERHVGLAENDTAGVLDARDRERVVFWLKVLLRGNTPGRGCARIVEGFLDREGKTE